MLKKRTTNRVKQYQSRESNLGHPYCAPMFYPLNKLERNIAYVQLSYVGEAIAAAQDRIFFRQPLILGKKERSLQQLRPQCCRMRISSLIYRLLDKSKSNVNSTKVYNRINFLLWQAALRCSSSCSKMTMKKVKECLFSMKYCIKNETTYQSNYNFYIFTVITVISKNN